MLNLVEKFTPEAVEATDEDGVVAIEYVIARGRRRRGPRRACGPPSATRWPTKLDRTSSTSIVIRTGGGQPPPSSIGPSHEPLTPIPS